MAYGGVIYKKKVMAIYFFTVILIAGLVSGLFDFEFLSETSNHGLVFPRPASVFIAFLLIGTLISLTNLENTYRKMEGSRLPIIVFISVLAFHVLFYSLSLGYSSMRVEFLCVISIALIVGSLFMSYPVYKHRGMHVDRVVIAKSYTLLMAGIYLLVIGMLGKIIQVIGKNLNFFIAFLSAFLILLILMSIIVSKSLRLRFQLFFERNFYKSKYDYRREWENFSRRVFLVLDTIELLHRIMDAVSETFEADSAYIMLLDDYKGEFFVAVPDNISGVISANHGFLDWIWRYGSPVLIEEGKLKKSRIFSDMPELPDLILKIVKPASSTSFAKNAEPRFSDSDKQGKDEGIHFPISSFILHPSSFIIMPIVAENRLIALITIIRMGPKGAYNQEDIDLLETMSNQISIAIMNSRKSQDLAITKELESFYRLSEMVLHDLKGSASMLSLVVQNAARNFNNPEFQKDALSTISSVITKIQKLIMKFSSPPQNANIQQMQPVNLNDVISLAITSSGIKVLSNINLNIELNPLPNVLLDLENIERVISNLIVNAVESITGDGTITISTSVDHDGYIQVSISDTGCGMSQDFIRYRLFQPFQTTKDKGIGIGLYQCKSIIDACGGIIEVQSKEGAGSTFTLKFPLKLPFNFFAQEEQKP